MTLERLLCAIDLRSLAPEAVERSAPGAAPTAFRIWRAGENQTDKGRTVFTEKSARELVTDQNARKNLYSIDVDHLSLSDTAPPESRKAVGWHRLEVRRDVSGMPELWATEVEWTDVARVGLEKSPPEWRYFSPAYDVDKKTREVTAYLNTALTNNPATWAVTALATSTTRRDVMTKKDMVAALTHMAGDSKNAQAVAAAVISMLESGKVPEDPKDDEPPAEKPAPADDEEAKKEAAKKDAADKAAAEKAAAEKTESDRVAAAARVKLHSDDVVVELASKVQTLEAKIAKDEEDKERERLFATRTDFAPEVKKALEGKPLEVLRFAVETFPRGAAKTAVTTVTATRGAGQGEGDGGTDRAPRLSPEEKRKLDLRMGIVAESGAIRRQDNRVSFGVMSVEEARKHGAAKTGGAA